MEVSYVDFLEDPLALEHHLGDELMDAFLDIDKICSVKLGRPYSW